MTGKKQRLEGGTCPPGTDTLENKQAYAGKYGYRMESFHSSKQSLETGGCCRVRAR